jgi:hypothetical protein
VTYILLLHFYPFSKADGGKWRCITSSDHQPDTRDLVGSNYPGHDAVTVWSRSSSLSNGHWMQHPQLYATTSSIRSNPLGRHGRACSGHPRLQCPKTWMVGQAPDVRDARDREKGATRGCAIMMKIRIAVVALATGMSPALAAPIPVALVEGVSGAPAGVEFMDYVETDNMAALSADGCTV